MRFSSIPFLHCLPFQNTRKAAFYRCISDGELVGAVASFSGNNTLPEGWLLCNGAAVSRETYAALFAVIGATYGTGDGTDTFNLPDLTDRFIQGNATSGTEKSAGLPNITGSIGFTKGATQGKYYNLFPYDATGAFYKSASQASSVSNEGASATTTTSRCAEFDASRSSSIYGNSTTVQPPALTMRYAIYSGVVSKKLWIRTI